MIGENFVFCTFEILIYHYEWHIIQKLCFFGFFPEVAGNIQSCMTRNALPCLWQEFFQLLIIQPKKKASDLWEWSLDQDLKSNGQSILSNEWQELKNLFLSFFSPQISFTWIRNVMWIASTKSLLFARKIGISVFEVGVSNWPNF